MLVLQLKCYPSIRGIALSSQFSKQEGGEPWGWLALSHTELRAGRQHSPHAPRPPLLPGAHPSTKTPQEVRFGQKAAAGVPVHKAEGHAKETFPVYAGFLLTSDHGHRAKQISSLTQKACVPPRKQTSVLLSPARGLCYLGGSETHPQGNLGADCHSS